MDKKLQDVHFIMNGDEVVLRAIHIVDMNICSGFIKINYVPAINVSLYKMSVKDLITTVLIPCLTGMKVLID